MCPPCVSIILILLMIFNSMYRDFFDLVWLWCLIICGLKHEFVSFNKPYFFFFFFFFLTHGRMMLKIMSLPFLLQKDSVLMGAPILSIVWVFWLLFNKLILKTVLFVCNKCKSLNSKMPLWQFVGRLLLVQPWICSSFVL